MSHKVFVYGSLLSGFYNHVNLQGAQLLGKAESMSKDYAMYTSGNHGFPFLIEGGEKVYGEVYLCNDEQLRRLDVLEGHPEFYARKERMFLVRGVDVLAWVYMYRGSVHQYRKVPDNDWRKFCEETKAVSTAGN